MEAYALIPRNQFRDLLSNKFSSVLLTSFFETTALMHEKIFFKCEQWPYCLRGHARQKADVAQLQSVRTVAWRYQLYIAVLLLHEEGLLRDKNAQAPCSLPNAVIIGRLVCLDAKAFQSRALWRLSVTARTPRPRRATYLGTRAKPKNGYTPNGYRNNSE